jgi:hypothetical protein
MADDETPDTPDTPESAAQLEDASQPLNPWAAIARWAAEMAAQPPEGFVPLRDAIGQIRERYGDDVLDSEAALFGPWLDRVEIVGFHMHIRPQRIDPDALRRGHIDEETWYRSPRYPIGAPQNRLWLAVTSASLAELLGDGSTAEPEQPPPPPEPWPSAPSSALAATPPVAGELACKLCALPSRDHWLLLHIGDRLVAVCMSCAREVASAVRRK